MNPAIREARRRERILAAIDDPDARERKEMRLRRAADQ